MVAWHRVLVLSALAVALVLVAAPARAAMMEHSDLTSLALEAEFIVRARQTAERKASEWETLHTMRVTRAYKGDLAVGSSFEVSYDLYSMVPFDAMWGQADAGAAPLGDEMIFFLVRAKAADGGLTGHRLVSSGLRIFLGGKAQRFEQWNNPGGFVPVPQRHDPFDLYDDPRAGEPLDLAGLEAEIARAMARADEVTAALAAPDSPAARQRLVDLVGPAPDDAPVGSGFGGFYENGAALRIVEALAARGDLPLTLEAVARGAGVPSFRLRAEFDVVRLLAVAAEPKTTMARRLAAMRLADGKWYEMRKAPEAEARVIALLADPSWEVRLNALSLHPTESPSARMKAAVLARWKTETDDRVRVALVHVGRSYEMRDELAAVPSALPIVVATRTRDVVRISWADLDARVNWSAKTATVTARRAGEPPRTQDLYANATYTNGATGDMTSRLGFRPPFSPGPIELEAIVELEDIATHRPIVTRRFPLGTMAAELVGPPPPPRGDEEPAAAPSASAAPIVPSRLPSAPRRSCGCEATPVAPCEGAWSCLAALALVGRRASRRRSH